MSKIEGAVRRRASTVEPDDSLRPDIRHTCTVTNGITERMYLNVSLNWGNMLCDGLGRVDAAYNDRYQRYGNNNWNSPFQILTSSSAVQSMLAWQLFTNVSV